jgi:hypothetical protein
MGLLVDDLLALSKVARTEMKRERVDLSDLSAHTSANCAGIRQSGWCT